MSPAEVLDPPFEPWDADWREEPMGAFRRLRDQAPVYQAPSGRWVVSRYADVQKALATPELFSNSCVDHEALGIPRDLSAITDPELTDLFRVALQDMPIDLEELTVVQTVIGADGSEHERQRGLINRAFSSRHVRELRTKMESIAAECVAGLDTAESFDAMADLGHVIPRRIIGDLLSVEPERHADLTRWTHEMMGATARGASIESHRRHLTTLREFSAFFAPRIESRRAQPTDDFIGDLVRAEQSDRLTPLETLLLVRLLMIAGTDSSGALIGNTILALMRHPDQVALLRQDPALIPAAIEESLRYWAPFYFVLRETTDTVVIEGVEIPKGAIVAFMLGAANHDEREFADPAIFDIRRRGRHITFGYGAHFCVGAHLARAEATVALEAVLPYLHRFELADEPLELVEHQTLNGLKRIPLVARKSGRA